jgi:flagellar biosynthesis protein
MNNANIQLHTLPNLHQQAVAIAYETGAYAPKVVAKGKGIIAEQIIAKAKKHKVFVHESKELVALLMQVDLDDHIPPELYLAIAEILAWLYRLETNADAIDDMRI